MASAGTAPATVNSAATVAKATALARVRVSARWFYWIAGLSLINSVVVISGGNFHFLVGLGITSVVDVLTRQAGSLGIVLDLIINGSVAAVFFLFGNCAGKAQKWAFFVGIGLYALDGLLLLMGGDIFSVGFHAFALYCLYRGLAASAAAVEA